MSNKLLLELINEGESQTVEFKSSFGKEVIESVVALTNTKGGHIYIGVKDNGEIVHKDYVSNVHRVLQSWKATRRDNDRRCEKESDKAEYWEVLD